MSRGLESSWIQMPGDPVNWLYWSSIISLQERKASQTGKVQPISTNSNCFQNAKLNIMIQTIINYSNFWKSSKEMIYSSKLLYLRFQNSGLLTSKALIIAVAKTSASSLLEKLSPYTCLLSLHWWKVGVAWLYFNPFNIAQFMTTWKKNIVWLVGSLILFYLMVLQLSSNHSEGAVYKMMINVNLILKGQVLS